MGINIPGKKSLYIETGPGLCELYSPDKGAVTLKKKTVIQSFSWYFIGF